MEGRGNTRSVIRTRSGYPLLEVNNNMQNEGDRKSGAFSAERLITYTMGKRSLSLQITEVGYADRVNVVLLRLSDEIGKGCSSAKLNLMFVRDDTYGVLCTTDNEFKGSFELCKKNYCVPPLPDAEVYEYLCRETGSRSCFILAKKKSKMEIVETVKATHAFNIDDELTYNVSIKITSNRRAGLSVEVEGPVKLTVDYTKYLVSTIEEKIGCKMDAVMSFLFEEAMQLGSKGNDRDSDGGNYRNTSDGNRKIYKDEVRNKIFV